MVNDDRWLTMLDAARTLGVTCHVIRALIRNRILPARQALSDTSWQILAADLKRPEVQAALRRRRTRQGRPIAAGDTPPL